jgi:hypothetical protein
MKTLYDLLGALADDGAEDLRTAFRRAVKGTHPDLNPDDPDAALKFRQIVRANEILSDEEQRAVYDHLVDLAQFEQESASRHAVAAVLHKIASGTMALVGAAALSIGGYLLFMHISVASVAVPPDKAAMIASLAPLAAANSVPSREAATKPAADAGKPRDLAVVAVTIGRASDVSADHHDTQDAIADLELPMPPEPKFTAAYIDRNIIFYRAQHSKRAFADIAPAKPAEKVSHSRNASPVARIQRAESRMTPVPRRRTAERDASREEGFPFFR